MAHGWTRRGPNGLFPIAGGTPALVGRPVAPALPELAGQGFFELLDGVYPSGEAFTGTGMPVMLQRHPGAPLEQRFVDLVYMPLRDADGLGGVVVVDMEAAIGLDRDVDPGMAGQQVQHVVEEADTGRDVGYAGAIEVHGDLDVGFLGLALDGRRAHENCFPWAIWGPKTRPF